MTFAVADVLQGLDSYRHADVRCWARRSDKGAVPRIELSSGQGGVGSLPVRGPCTGIVAGKLAELDKAAGDTSSCLRDTLARQL